MSALSCIRGSVRDRALGLVLLLVLVAPATTWAQTATPAGGETASASEARIRALEAEVRALREALAEMRAEREEERQKAEAQQTVDQRLDEVTRRLDVLAGELERVALGGAASTTTGGASEPAPVAATATLAAAERGLAPSASKVYRVEEGLSIGGYGEMLYEGFDSSRDDGTDAGESDQLDFLRAIVYFGYKFNDKLLFNSEIEFEHASVDQGGDVSVEFAYLDYLLRPELNLRAGLLLVPMGFVNELHEPPIFLGARRPDTEQRILPTTWRENGFGLYGDLGPFSYRTYLVNGFDASGFSASGVRGGRQKGSEALADDFAWVGRLDYTGTPGLLVGGSFYTGDAGQDLIGPDGRGLGVGTTILEGHLEWKWRGWELRALAAQSEIDDVAALNQTLGLFGDDGVGEEQEGWYVQLGYDVFSRLPKGEMSLIPYARWEAYDTQARVPAGFLRDPARDVDSLTLGLAFKPLDKVILKLDYQDYDNEAGTALDQVNVAIGYLF